MKPKTAKEKSIKDRIRAVLDAMAPYAYYEMWVPSGYGKRGVDFNVCIFGRALYIEAKRDGKYPTPQQRNTLKNAYLSGAACFIISNDDGLQALIRWIYKLFREQPWTAE